MTDRTLTALDGKKVSAPVAAIILFSFTATLISHFVQRMWPLDSAIPGLPLTEQYRWLDACLLLVLFAPILIASKVTVGEIVGHKPALSRLIKVSTLAALTLILYGFAQGFWELSWLGFGATIARTPVQGDVPFNIVITLDRFLSLPLGAWLGFASVVIIAPIAEEIVYRGILLRRLLATRSVSTAVCASAVVFMLAHLGQGQLLFTFFAGVVFAYIYLKTSSLRYGILAHFLVNLNSATQKSLVDYQGRGGDTVLGISLPFIIATLLFLAVLILLLWLSKILRTES